MTLRKKRVYEPPADDDGYRVLIDRLWPRGLRKEAAHVDAWLKDLAPSDELRRWFNHDPERFAQFRARYQAELRVAPAAALVRELAGRSTNGTVTLVYAAKDEEHNNAVVLASVITKKLRTAKLG
jgi:uncharacterized protein YeaO (DUF488 family)